MAASRTSASPRSVRLPGTMCGTTVWLHGRGSPPTCLCDASDSAAGVSGSPHSAWGCIQIWSATTPLYLGEGVGGWLAEGIH